MRQLDRASASFCLFMVAALVATTADARQCRWIGTAPSCDVKPSDCGADEDFIEYAGSASNSQTGNSLAEFGAPCTFGGGKALCCKKEAPAPVPPPQTTLTPPDATFCNWYASEAVARAAQGAKCGFTGARWDPIKQHHFDWCMQQKSQQQGWSEHNARVGQLADCAKSEAANAPPKMNNSVGAPVVTVPQDVDVYAEAGGAGTPVGVLKAGSRPQLYESRPDQWCRVAGNAVPNGGGWVWCGEGFELK